MWELQQTVPDGVQPAERRRAHVQVEPGGGRGEALGGLTRREAQGRRFGPCSLRSLRRQFGLSRTVQLGGVPRKQNDVVHVLHVLFHALHERLCILRCTRVNVMYVVMFLCMS